MVLAGLVIALGEVVDDAIIDVENIVRRLRLNRTLAQPQSALAVVFDASIEVRSAVVFGSLIVMLVFLPVFMLEGLSGAFFRPLATVLRARDSVLAGRRVDGDAGAVAADPCRAPRWREESRLVAHAEGLVSRRSAASDRPTRDGRRRRWRCSWSPTLRGSPLLGEEFLPNFREYDFLMHWVEKPGTSIEAMRAHHRAGQQGAARDPGRAKLRIAYRPGRGRRRSGRAELHRTVDQPRSQRRLRSDGRQASRHVVDGYPGLYRDLLDLSARAHQGSADRRQRHIVVRIEGPDLDRLQAHAAAVHDALGADRRRRRSQSAAAGAGAANRGEVQTREGRAAWPHGGGCAPRRHHRACTARRPASSSRISASSMSWSGAPLRRATVSMLCARSAYHCPGGSTVPLNAVADVADRAGPERNHAREWITPHRRHVQCAGPRSGFGRARHRSDACDARSRRRLPRRSSGRVCRTRGIEPIAADVGSRRRWSASF